ncbi:MAG: aminomethyl-transferring glycine dehydrogenase subunit GcvPB [Chitinispirillia bacterium]|nr:aminomethyl-transferring glycine dehydrogenase subunit GcvPB [Chitinispirillia bacterium]MCL2241118.1 aminomethyl-transferring glycine dehydrogenase subunit GcvPB [Chitinispirillia bacterium]
MSIIFEKSITGRRGVTLPKNDVPVNAAIPEKYLRKSRLDLCELSELDVVRHFTGLSKKNYGVDTNFYPLGSCTMKYNPKICEKIAGMDGFASIHPVLAQLPGGHKYTQGALSVIHHLEELLCKITGMDAFTLQPLAGAHGEFTGLSLIAAHHRKNGSTGKTEVLIPDEAHGTNPSSAAAAGYEVRAVPTGPATGLLDIEAFKAAVSGNTAAVMMTNPNTLGLFNPHIKEIAQIAHAHGALMYYDGANLNAIMGKFRPGDGDFDVMHVNLHKTFATPHGGGGPGSGPVGVKAFLEPFLPTPRIIKTGPGGDNAGNVFALNSDYPGTIGKIAPFYGNFSVILKAYAYILMLGGRGLTAVSEQAVLNANYVMHSLKDHYYIPYLKTCMHECVLTAKRQGEYGVKALDIAKGLIDRGIHPPTVYFPLTVKEAMMVEPTETESREVLDAFAAAMVEIAGAAASAPESLHRAPVSSPVGRLNETKAARDMDVAFL